MAGKLAILLKYLQESDFKYNIFHFFFCLKEETWNVLKTNMENSKNQNQDGQFQKLELLLNILWLYFSNFCPLIADFLGVENPRWP